MGLSEPKQKQRFGSDPQNKTWKGDKEAVGFKLMERMGWREGMGMGVNGEGRTENIKVALKLDNKGIGRDARASSDNWLENSFGFDEMLKGFAAPPSSPGGDTEASNSAATIFIMPEEAEKGAEAQAADAASNKTKTAVNGRHSHRQKFIRNKKVSNYDQQQVNNILGKGRNDIDSDAAVKVVEVKSKELPLTTLATVPSNAMHTTTTSKLAIGDYFAQKMASKGINLATMTFNAVPAAPSTSRVEETSQSNNSISSTEPPTSPSSPMQSSIEPVLEVGASEEASLSTEPQTLKRKKDRKEKKDKKDRKEKKESRKHKKSAD